MSEQPKSHVAPNGELSAEVLEQVVGGVRRPEFASLGLESPWKLADSVLFGAGNIVAAGAGNIVAAGAGNIVSSGAGNLNGLNFGG